MKPFLAIHSAHAEKYRAQADACRDTWLRGCPIDYRFIVGGGEAYAPDVLCVNAPDTYLGLPLKLQAMMQWALDNGYTHVFKCDDDTYVHIPRLLESRFERWDYTGYDWRGEGGYCSGGSGHWTSARAMEMFVKATLRADEWLNELYTKWSDDLQLGEVLRAGGIRPYGDERYRLRQPGPGPLNRNITIHDESDRKDRIGRIYRAHEFAKLI